MRTCVIWGSKLSLAFTLVVSIILASLSVYLLVSDYSFNETAVEVDGVITDIVIERDYHPREIRYDYYVTVQYTYDGETYTGDYGFYTKGMEIGDVVTVLVNPDNPREIMAENSYTLLWAMLAFSCAGMIICIVGLVKKCKRVIVF